MPRHVYAKDHPIPGEVWKATPCGMASVSDQGRLQNLHGELIAPCLNTSGEGPKWRVKCGGRFHRLYDPANLVAHVFLGATLGRGGGVTFRNGKTTDFRAANLRTPWSPTEDRVILDALSVREAARILRRGTKSVRTRARALGASCAQPRGSTPLIPLGDRIAPVIRAVEVLEAAGIGDERINLALRIDDRARYDYGGMKDPSGHQVCITALHQAGWSPAEIAEAFGWPTGAPVARRKMRAYGLIPETGRDGTILGAVDTIDGEAWLKHETGYWVSDHGRVAGPKGLLKPQYPPRAHPRVRLTPLGGKGKHTSKGIGQMMLEAFRPGLRYSAALFANGDVTDIRLANIRVPIDVATTVGRIRGYPIYGVMPDWLPAVRQDALAALMEGRAFTVSAAVGLALREHHDQLGARRSESLDKERPSGGTGHDRLSSTGEMLKSPRAGTRRPSY